MNIPQQLPQALLPWYDQARRDLPWRQDRDPYHIWISEIMLQQTRVEAVKGYYARFLEALPTIEALAQAEEEQLHKLWEGLGYYSRVRNLKKAAVMIMERYGGVFPREYEKILALPGIGGYTAGAIASIAFDQKRAAVDGNVLRVVTRLWEDPTPIEDTAFKKQVCQALEAVYPPEAGKFTQALMELGATICGPDRGPRCGECPCYALCAAGRHSTAGAFPVRAPKRPRRQEDRTVFIVSCDGRFALEKRPKTGLLAGLWQFPNAEGKLEVPQALAWAEAQGLRPKEIFRQTERDHIFTHIHWKMRGIYLEVTATGGGFTWLTARQIQDQAALPTAFRQFWEEIGNV